MITHSQGSRRQLSMMIQFRHVHVSLGPNEFMYYTRENPSDMNPRNRNTTSLILVSELRQRQNMKLDRFSILVMESSIHLSRGPKCSFHDLVGVWPEGVFNISSVFQTCVLVGVCHPLFILNFAMVLNAQDANIFVSLSIRDDAT